MPKQKLNSSRLLSRKIGVRVSQPFYEKMLGWLTNSNCRTIGELARRILYEEKINWYHKDASSEEIRIQLTGIRKELKAIGVNVNQVTRHFNATSGDRLAEASLVLAEFQKVERTADVIMTFINKLSEKWSSESEAEKI